MKKLTLILLLVIGMTLSFLALFLVMLFFTETVKSWEEARVLLMGEMIGSDSTLVRSDDVAQLQDALLLLQQQRQELEQDLLELEEKRGTLQGTRDSLSQEVSTLTQQGQAGSQDQTRLREERLSQLTTLYDAMRPADAATIMDKMSDDMILEILTRLKDRQAARILNALTGDDRKAKLSAQLLSGKPAQSP